MTQLGMGAMIGALSGNKDTVETNLGAIGKVIASARVNNEGDGSLELRFADGTGIAIFDDGRSCCESRYITCDDDLSKLAGEVYRGAELKPGPEEPEGDWGDCHETTFVEIQTASGTTATLTTHNEHNGYYGGFWFKVEPLAAIAIEAGTDTTRSGVAEGESAGLKGIAQTPPGDHND